MGMEGQRWGRKVEDLKGNGEGRRLEGMEENKVGRRVESIGGVETWKAWRGLA